MPEHVHSTRPTLSSMSRYTVRPRDGSIDLPINGAINPSINPSIDSRSVADLNQSFALHQRGRLEEAEAGYRQLRAVVVFPLASYYLGLLCLQRANAIEAAKHFDAALAVSPDNAAWLNDRGIAAVAMHDHAGAADFYRRALTIAPDFALAHCNLGNALRHAGQYDEAIDHYGRALDLEPGLIEAALHRGAAFEVLARNDDAIACFLHAATIADADVRPFIRLGNLLNGARRHHEAAAYFERAVRIKPRNVDSLFGLAYAYDAQRQFGQAIDFYRQAVALQPDSADLHNNLAYSLTCIARYDEADAHFTRAIELKPTLSEAHQQLAMSALRRGNFKDGWRGYEHRKTTASGLRSYQPLAFREWRGEPVAGKRFLLAREQGAGDQLQFVRYAAVLRALGATVDVWTTPELAGLFSRATGVTRVLTDAPQDGYDFWCRVMSVPNYLDDASIPASTPYLFADSDAAHAWRLRLSSIAGAKKKVGLVWAGNPQHHLDALRSVTLATLKPFATVPDVEWFAIQKGDAQRQLADVAGRWPINALGPQLETFDITAAALDALDLVVTVDTSVAHLAGAMGKPVWVLLAAQSDWRWMLSRPDSLWYPGARLFRQTVLGDWTDVVASVRAALIAS
jgi:tetratricopeptide (TPR) repeat protein